MNTGDTSTAILTGLRQYLPGVTTVEHGDNLAIHLASYFETHAEGAEMDAGDTWEQCAVDAGNRVMDAIHAHYSPTIIVLHDEAMRLAQERAEALALLRKHHDLSKGSSDVLDDKVGAIEFGNPTDYRDSALCNQTEAILTGEPDVTALRSEIERLKQVGCGASDLPIRLHNEGVVSEGQVAKVAERSNDPAPSSAAASAVDHPAHYGGANNPYEAIKVIDAWGLGFCLGNTVKYVSRAGKKDAAKHLEDLRKARWYLDREITNLEKANG